MIPLAEYHEQYRQVAGLLQQMCRIHLVGADGVGVAGLADLLHAAGHEVSVCDQQNGDCLKRLTHAGIQSNPEHAAGHIHEQLDFVVVSTAIPASHPEVRKAEEMKLPVFRRGIVLAALMHGRPFISVAGSHGKTTTTSLLVQLMETAGPVGYFIGGVWRDRGKVSHGPADAAWYVVESDESDGTLALYEPDTLLITNIEADHLEHHGSESGYRDCFLEAAGRTAKQIVMHTSVSALVNRLQLQQVKAVTFGMNADEADYSGILENNMLSVYRRGELLGCWQSPLPGEYNAENILGAVAAAVEKKVSAEAIAEALSHYKPVLRRAERLTSAEAEVSVYLDYAHHPTEIKAFIAGMRADSDGRLLVVFQPHRYTRTAAFLDQFPACFLQADQVWLCPVYAASEQPSAGADSKELFTRCHAQGVSRVHLSSGCDEAFSQALSAAVPGDRILLIGAGDIERLKTAINTGV